MNRRLLLVLCVVLAPPAGWARWIEVESDSFVFTGEVEEEDARQIVTDLEIYRQTILNLAGIRGSPEVRKVHVFGMRKIGDVRKLTGLKGIAGAYVNGNDYPVFVGVAGWTDDAVRSIMFHEYAHHVLNAHTIEYFPRWYDEGFAEYLASFKVQDDIISIGVPSSQFGGILNAPRWTDIDIVLNSITAYPYEWGGSWRDNRRAVFFYGMSWLAVHYLQNTPELNRGLSDYLALLSQGTDPVAAFETGFGITQEEFYDRLRLYWRQDRFPFVQFRITEAFELPSITVREVTKAKAEIALAGPRALFISADSDKAAERAGVRRDLQALVEKHGPSSSLYNALMLVELKDENYDGAVAIGRKALAAAPDDPLAIQTLADALYHRHLDSGSKDTSDVPEARALFGRQLELEPTNPTANSHYPVTFIFDHTPPDKKALEAVAFNVRYRRNPGYFDSYLENAEVLAMAGLADRACVLLSRVDLWIRASDGEATTGEEQEGGERRSESRLERLDRLQGTLEGRCPAE